MKDPKRGLVERAKVLEMLEKAGGDISYLAAVLDSELEEKILALEMRIPNDPRVKRLRAWFDVATRGGKA